MGLVQHAKSELKMAGLLDKDTDFYGGMTGKSVLELMELFVKQGHSGMSAPMVASIFSKLAKYETINPLTGGDDEWNDVSNMGGDDDRMMYQNKRRSAVFKDGDDGTAYYIDAIVFNGDVGGSFTSNGSVQTKDGTVVTSRQYIKKFPFTPKTFYIDVIDKRYDKNKETGELTLNPDGDWWEHEIKDETQLKEVFEYYDIKEYKSKNKNKK